MDSRGPNWANISEWFMGISLDNDPKVRTQMKWPRSLRCTADSKASNFIPWRTPSIELFVFNPGVLIYGLQH
jgi:hypothetical protein